MSKRRVPDALEARLDELLWQVAAELEPDLEHTGPPEVRAERVRADVRRWMKTRASEGNESFDPVSRTRRAAYPWLRAAVLVLAVGGFGAAGYWGGWVAPRSPSLRAEGPVGQPTALTRSGDAESWYVQVARLPDPMRHGECASDSWYCVQARPESSRRDL